MQGIKPDTNLPSRSTPASLPKPREGTEIKGTMNQRLPHATPCSPCPHEPSWLPPSPAAAPCCSSAVTPAAAQLPAAACHATTAGKSKCLTSAKKDMLPHHMHAPCMSNSKLYLRCAQYRRPLAGLRTRRTPRTLLPSSLLSMRQEACHAATHACKTRS